MGWVEVRGNLFEKDRIKSLQQFEGETLIRSDNTLFCSSSRQTEAKLPKGLLEAKEVLIVVK